MAENCTAKALPLAAALLAVHAAIWLVFFLALLLFVFFGLSILSIVGPLNISPDPSALFFFFLPLVLGVLYALAAFGLWKSKRYAAYLTVLLFLVAAYNFWPLLNDPIHLFDLLLHVLLLALVALSWKKLK